MKMRLKKDCTSNLQLLTVVYAEIRYEWGFASRKHDYKQLK